MYISVNTIKVKHANNETKDGEPLVAYNSVIDASSYFKLFECSKNLLNKLDVTCEQACVSNSKHKYSMEFFNIITN